MRAARYEQEAEGIRTGDQAKKRLAASDKLLILDVGGEQLKAMKLMGDPPEEWVSNRPGGRAFFVKNSRNEHF